MLCFFLITITSSKLELEEAHNLTDLITRDLHPPKSFNPGLAGLLHFRFLYTQGDSFRIESTY